MKFIQILMFCLLSQIAIAHPSPGKKAQTLTVKAKVGDGVYSILRKYKLLDDPDNLNRFYKLNKLKPNASLLAGRTYKLPIQVYRYDGKSIESSIGTQDKRWSKSVLTYNGLLVDAKVKQRCHLKDKCLYVPDTDKKTLQSLTVEESPIAVTKSIQKTALKEKSEVQSLGKGQDNRKQFLIAGMKPFSANAELVAERKLTASEIKTLNAKNLAEKSTAVGSALRVSTNTLKVPLFGEAYENVVIKEERLKNQVFYIVPGHGGPDPGAIAKNVEGKYTICEDEYAYDVSLRLAKNLMENGAVVYLIVEDENDGIRDEHFLDCDSDETTFGGSKIPVSQKKRLKQGISKVNKLYKKHKKQGYKSQWMVSIHIDAQGEENRQDVFFYYQSESATSKEKAVDIQNVFEDKYQVYRRDREYNGSVSARPLYVVRHSDPEPIFIELANIHNEEDRKRILIPRNRQLLADWITEGFLLH